jgi:hypothetical protein
MFCRPTDFGASTTQFGVQPLPRLDPILRLDPDSATGARKFILAVIRTNKTEK